MANSRVIKRVLIYRILNKVNGKSYIGQTVNSFDRRYDGGKWWVYTGNISLQRASVKYGVENFEVIILEDEIKTEEVLNEREIFWINYYNTIKPNGYNFIEGGKTKKHHPETADKIALILRGKALTFKSPNGNIFEVVNLTRFCRENDLDKTMMYYVSIGKNKKHKGWTLPNISLIERKIISPIGEVFSIKEGELRSFCREHALVRESVINVLNGKKIQYKGWKKYNE